MSTLTVYPDAGDPGTTTCDGVVYKSDATWAGARDAATGTVGINETSDNIARTFYNSAGPTYHARRGFFLFDSSALTAAATISAGVISFAGTGAAVINIDTSSIHIVASTPASNTALAAADFAQTYKPGRRP